MIEVRQSSYFSMLLQASYRLTAEDFNQAQAQHKGLLGRFLQIIGVMIILSALPALFAHQYSQGTVTVVVSSFLAFGTRLLASYSFKKETSLQLETKVVISEQGLLFTSARSESRLNWNAFVRYTETKDTFVLYVQSRMFHILPKRAFPQEGLATIRDTFNRHIEAPSRPTEKLGIKSFLFVFLVAAAVVLVYFAAHAIR